MGLKITAIIIVVACVPAICSCSRGTTRQSTRSEVDWSSAESIVVAIGAQDDPQRDRYYLLEDQAAHDLATAVRQRTEHSDSSLQLFGGAMTLLCQGRRDQTVVIDVQSAPGVGGKHAPTEQRDAALATQRRRQEEVLTLVTRLGRLISLDEFYRRQAVMTDAETIFLFWRN